AVSRAHHHLVQAKSLAHELGSRLWEAIVSALLARAYIQQRDFTAASNALTEAAAFDAPMRILGDRMHTCAHAELKLAGGDAEGALGIVDQLIESDPNRAPGAVVPQLWRVRGQALATLRRRAEAEAIFLSARDRAQARGLRPELWRLHLSVALLYRS